MTKTILIYLCEECDKLATLSTKAVKYGLFDKRSNNSKTIGDRIMINYYRIQAIIESLQRDHLLPVYSKDYINNIKRNTIKQLKERR